MGAASAPHGDPLAAEVARRGGDRVLRRVLVANNGMAAARCLRSLRKWEQRELPPGAGLHFVAMATPEDIRANAEYFRLADEYVIVPGGPSANNYSDVALIVDLVRRYRIDAVWPGWGHASENPDLPAGVEAAGAVFVGPPRAAMAAVGDKVQANLLAQSIGMRVLPWSGSKVVGRGDAVDELKCRRACVRSILEAVEGAKGVGFPLVVKASEGGGGKGIRKCRDMAALKAGFKQVQSEVPGSPIFLQRLARDCRHLEIQVLADAHGHVMSLYGRDCSVQRRHQKIIEEGPITAAPPEVRRELEEGACRLLAAIGYRGAGTVEFLYSPASNEYSFLEVNPRLQVEHPVSEMISGVCIPACQLLVAMGVPLHRIPGVRRLYGADPAGAGPLDLGAAKRAPLCHCVAARITVEDPAEGFKPTTGSIEVLNFSPSLGNAPAGVDGYFSIGPMGQVHPYADSQIGHVFVSGTTRDSARLRLASALEDLTIHGETKHNVDALKDILTSPEFAGDAHHTGWLDGLIAENRLFATPIDPQLAVVAGAVVKAIDRFYAMQRDLHSYLLRGVVPSPDMTHFSEHPLELIYAGERYAALVRMGGPTALRHCGSTVDIEINRSHVEVEVVEMCDEAISLQMNGRRHILYHKQKAQGLHVQVDKQHCFFPEDVDPTALKASSACKVVGWLVPDGALVRPGAAYAEVEVMKTVMPLVAKVGPGHLTILKAAGALLEAGESLGKLALLDGAGGEAVRDFAGVLVAEPSADAEARPLQRTKQRLGEIERVLMGYHALRSPLEGVLASLTGTALVCREFQHIYARAEETLKEPAYLAQLADQGRRLEGLSRGPPLAAHAHAVHAETVSAVEAIAGIVDKLRQAGGPPLPFLAEFCEAFKHGMRGYAHATLSKILRDFLRVEEIFDSRGYDNAVFHLRDKHKGALDVAISTILANSQLEVKIGVVARVLDHIARADGNCRIADFLGELERLADLKGDAYSKIAQRAKEMLYRQDNIEWMAGDAKGPSPRASLSGRTGSLGVLLENDSTELLSSLNTSDHEMDVVPISDVLVDDCLTRLAQAAAGPDDARCGIVRDLLQKFGYDRQGLSVEGQPGRVWATIGYDTVACFLDGLDDVAGALDEVFLSYGGHKHLLLFATRRCVALTADAEDPVDRLCAALGQARVLLRKTGLEMASCTFRVNDALVSKSFPRSSDFGPDAMLDGVHCLTVAQLELVSLAPFGGSRMPGLDAELYQDLSYRMQTYYVEEAAQTAAIRRESEKDKRVFVRCALHNAQHFLAKDPKPRHARKASQDAAPAPQPLKRVRSKDRMALAGQPERQAAGGAAASFEGHILTKILTALDVAVAEKGTAWNCIFVNLLDAPPEALEPVVATLKLFVGDYAGELRRLGISWIEVSLGAHRVFGYNPAGHFFKFKSAGPGDAPSKNPYQALSKLQRKQMMARNANSTYVYDFIDLFQHVLTDKFQATELALDAGGALAPLRRAPGENDVGMVVWSCSFRTPEYPDGREIVLAASDITFQSGSFSPAEDVLYTQALEHARARGLPFVYVSANSGARIGLDEAAKRNFRIKWADPADPNQGIAYLYYDERTYRELRAQGSRLSVEPVEGAGEGGATVYRILEVFGGIGVEALQGSGMIAHATSAAYEDIFTLTYVTGRAVGIGAYISRLSQRVIQHKDAPIILTGSAALNKVLSKAVYSSNLQIGGPKVMAHNGVSHAVVEDDVQGVQAVLRWLSFVPRRKGAPLPVLAGADPVDREVGFRPLPGVPYDPRHLLAGAAGPDGAWAAGFFDRGSFQEYLADWGKSVVTGRARLGGIPVGAIAVETRTTERIIPADPGFESSRETVQQQAGNVWFPDSAHKTAQAIRDFDREGLPLIVFANWRGFAGGLRDMYHEILKFGSLIVDALRAYRRPVIVYLPPEAELRGGAWVVIDPHINPDRMAMYAAETAKGNVLEPEGIVGIKFREKDLRACMQRLGKETGDAKALLPAFKVAATQFAALHDTPGVMLAKGAIEAVVPWATSRAFFHADLRRKLERLALERDVSEAHPRLGGAEAERAVGGLLEAVRTKGVQEAVLEGAVQEGAAVKASTPPDPTQHPAALRALAALRQRYVRDEVARLSAESLGAALAGLMRTHEKDVIAAALERVLELKGDGGGGAGGAGGEELEVEGAARGTNDRVTD